MNPVEQFFALMVVAMVIAAIAKRFELPYPLALVVGGLALSLLPGLPAIRLDPEIVFFLFLPPVLAEAAYFTSWRDFWRYRRPILGLAFGLVTFTTLAVAAICEWLIPGMSWAAGLTLGAIVSPPDAAAATSVMRGLRLPRKIVQILEGESLVNDASALVLYRFAVAAIVTGHFSMSEASMGLAWVTLGGAGIGLGMGWLYVKLYPFIRDPEVEILSTLAVSYSYYFIAEQVHASGVLATVAGGMVVGWHAPTLFSSTMRIRTVAVWQSIIFVVNALIFILIGLQLPTVMAELGGYPPAMLAGWAAAVTATVIGLRLLWVFPGAYLSRVLLPCSIEEQAPSRKGLLIIGWTGLRGVVSLAAALSLPLETNGGLPFPYRSLILFLTFVVILVTLLLQGFTLRPLIRGLGITADRSSEEELLLARIHSTEQALARLVSLEAEIAVPPNVLQRVRGYFEDRLSGLREQLSLETGNDDPENPSEFRTLAEQRLWWELARAERQAVLALRAEQRIGDEALHEIEREIDLLEARLVPKGH
ncbi:MAG: Na+/H+ antiporter [Bryobacteraceae bacterium]|nr:Na+/H+ antiporter [Bryobacteraceae bacterium]